MTSSNPAASRTKSTAFNFSFTPSVKQPEDEIPVVFYVHYQASGQYSVATGCLMLICAVLATAGNSVITVVVIRKRLLLQTVTHMFVLNLAISHLLLCCVCVPLEATSYLTHGNWVMGGVTCKFIRSLHTVFTSASMLTLSAIAIDRYYSVVYPLERKLSAFKAKLMIFWVWVHSLVISLPRFFTYNIRTYNSFQICVDAWNTRLQAQIYFMAYFLFTLFFPILVTIMAYCFVWRAFKLSQRRINVMKPPKRSSATSFIPYTSKTEVRLLKMLFFMVFCCLIFWTPYVVFRFQYYFGRICDMSLNFALTAVWMTKLQPVFDPMIYGYLNRNFRHCLKEQIRRCPCTCLSLSGSDPTVTTADPLTAPPADQTPRRPAQTTSSPSEQAGPNQQSNRNVVQGISISADYHITANVKVKKYEMSTNRASGYQAETHHAGDDVNSDQYPCTLGIRPINYPRKLRRQLTAPMIGSTNIPIDLYYITPLQSPTQLSTTYTEVAQNTRKHTPSSTQRPRDSRVEQTTFSVEGISSSSPVKIRSSWAGCTSNSTRETDFQVSRNSRNRLPPLSQTSTDEETSKVSMRRRRRKKRSYEWLKGRQSTDSSKSLNHSTKEDSKEKRAINDKPM